MIIDSFSADGKFDISQVWAYFWLPSLQPDIYAVKTQTCRWSHTVNIEVYPDIEWKAAFTISLKNPLAYTHSNKKAGEIFKNAQKKARKSGYDRYQLSQGNAVPEEFSLSLEVSWNDPKITHEVGKEWAKKIHAFLNLLMKIKNMADAVKDSAGGKVKSNKLLGKSTFSIEVYSPVIGAELNWKFEREDDKPHLVSPKGVLSLTADPLIGGEFVIDLLEIAGKANPVVYTIKKGVDLALNQLKRQFVLDLTFYGQLNITLDTVLAAKRLGDDFERVEDKDHKKQLRKSDIKITKENETDTDVITDPAKPEYEVEKVQNFVINKDYEYSGEDKLILKLNYIYNKSYDNEILNYLSQDQKILQYNEFGKLVANIWVVRYLIKLAKNKDFFQTYFVPVSTCRYPNQIVKVRVFPDMKWVLNFNYNIKEPLYYNDSPTQLDYFDRSKNEFDDLSGNIRRAEEASIKKRVASAYHNLKSGFAFSLDCEVSGEEPIHLSKAFSKKYRNTLKPIFDIIEFLDTTLGISKAKEEDERQTRTSASYVKRKGIRDLPVSFELKPPSLGLGIAIGYTTDKNYVQTWGIEGRIIAAPLIGAEVRLDLLALGSKIKPWGIILDALDIAAWAAETLSGGRLEVDYKIEIVFESEVNLVGRKTGEDEETKEPTYEKYGNIKYNFAEKGAIGDFGVQGIIKGKIEISFEIKIQAKVKNAKGTNIGDKHRMEDKGKIGMGAKAESYISLTIPTNCNAEGNLDVNCYFSGVKFEAWFKVSLSSKSTDEKPDISKQVVDEISFPQIIIL